MATKRSQNLILKWKLLVEFLNQNTLSPHFIIVICLFTPKRLNCNKTNFLTLILFLHRTIFFYKDEIYRLWSISMPWSVLPLVLLFGKKDKAISTSATPRRDLTKSQLWTGILYSFYWEHCYVSLFLYLNWFFCK